MQFAQSLHLCDILFDQSWSTDVAHGFETKAIIPEEKMEFGKTRVLYVSLLNMVYKVELSSEDRIWKDKENVLTMVYRVEL